MALGQKDRTSSASRTEKAIQEAVRKTTEEGKAEEAKAAELTFNWADMLTEDEYSTDSSGTTVDVMKEVPAPVRDFVERSLKAYGEALTLPDNSATFEKDTPKFQNKRFPDSTTAAEFVRLCHRYAKYRPAGRITVRATEMKARPGTVRIAAMPFVERPRLSEAEKAKRAADKAKKAEAAKEKATAEAAKATGK